MKSFRNRGEKWGNMLCGTMLITDVIDFIDDAPTLDLVPSPVRCGECKYRDYECDIRRCVNDDFYCADGKRKEQK